MLQLGIPLLLTAILAMAAFGSEAQAPSPESIRPAGVLELVGLVHDNQALSRAHDVELQGDFAFVPGKGGSLAIINVADRAAPKLVSALVDPLAYEDAQTVLPAGDVLFLGTRDFFSIDIRDPSKPRVLKKISDRPRIDFINGMALFGSYVLTANKSGYIGVFDIRNPADPRYVEALHTAGSGGPQMPHDIAVWGNHAIVVDTRQHTPHSVYVYQIALPGHSEILPVAQWTLSGRVSNQDNAGDLQGANRVVTWGGRYAAVGAFQPDRVGILDLSDPVQPRQLANLPVCDIDATGMAIYGRMLLVSGGECVEVIDVSNPAQPISVAQYRGGALFPTRALQVGRATRYDNGHDLVYRDGFIYVTAQNDNRLGILKVKDQRIRELAAPQQK